MSRPSGMQSFPLLLLAATLLSLQPDETAGQFRRNPCHPDKGSLGRNSTCRAYVVPPRLCSACRLNPWKDTGIFRDCSAIYNVTAPSCKRQIQRYASNNPCDGPRVFQTANFEAHVQDLDYFVYSICEECCDCVPVGATPRQYSWRSRTGKLFDVKGRGNCATHAAVDVCMVWPNVRTVVAKREDIPSRAVLDGMPDVCNVVRSWRAKRVAGELTPEEEETVPIRARPFLENFMNVAQCGAKWTWKRCARLEADQDRI